MNIESLPAACAEAIDNLYALLDAELTEDVRARVQQHFEVCPECFPLYRFEGSFCRFVKARRAAATAPEGLRRQVFEALLLDDRSDSVSVE